jgi:hypothetical protein
MYVLLLNLLIDPQKMYVLLLNLLIDQYNSRMYM